ncbi:MAG: EAL domain-containing protein [Deltaproteobacteria bacterium]|nr:EAL domain-containing protein [Deltaproteobacteria bacterium]
MARGHPGPSSRGARQSSEPVLTPKGTESMTSEDQNLSDNLARTGLSRYEEIFLRAPVGIFQTTPNGRFKDMNPRFAKIFGWPSVEAMYEDVTDIRTQLHAEESTFDAFGAELDTHGRVDDYRLPMLRRDGTRFWASVTAIQVTDDQGRFMGTDGFLMDCTEQVALEEALQENEANFRVLTNSTSCAIFILQDGFCRYMNPSGAALCGRTLTDLSRKPFSRIFSEDNLSRYEEFLGNIQNLGGLETGRPLELPVRRPDGEDRWMETRIRPILFNGEPSLLVTAFDITDRKEDERVSMTLFRISNAVSVTRDIQDLYAFIFKILQEMTSAPNFFIGLVDEENDRIVFPFYHDERDEYINIENISDPNTKSLVLHVLRTSKTLWATRDEIGQLLQDGVLDVIGSFPAVWVGVPLNIKGKILGVLAVQDYENPNRFKKRDVDLIVSISEQIGMAIERKIYEDQLTHMALHDELTGLPNRALFLERLDRALARAKRRGDYLFSVIMLDLDRFKTINDGHGHMVGDMLLREIGQRLPAVLRNMDTMARLGGDEFAILLEELRSPRETILVVKRIRQMMARPLTIDGQPLHTSASIGIVLETEGYERAEDLLRDADIAMYQAKDLGRDRFRVFNRRMHDRAVELMTLEAMLRDALRTNEIHAAFQPILSSSGTRLDGFEALARWTHAEKGPIPPSEFIPVAEESGLIIPLGESILRQACSDMSRWIEIFPALGGAYVSVNLSPVQLNMANFSDRLQRILEESGLPPANLKLEITETALMANPDVGLATLKLFHGLGIRLSIDDFGTGYSSLSYLQRFPVRTIKIDRSFVEGLGLEAENYEIVRAIVALSHSLNMDVVAEGVEKRRQLDILDSLACESVQGFLFARPMGRFETEVYLRNLLGISDEN